MNTEALFSVAVGGDGRVMTIQDGCGWTMYLSRDEAMALVEAITMKLGEMAVDISRKQEQP